MIELFGKFDPSPGTKTQIAPVNIAKDHKSSGTGCQQSYPMGGRSRRKMSPLCGRSPQLFKACRQQHGDTKQSKDTEDDPLLGQE